MTHTHGPEPQTVYIDGEPFPTVGELREEDLARLPPKTTIGPYTHESDPIFATWSMESWTGGGQKEWLVEGSDTDRYWTGTLEARWANQLTLGPEILSVSGTSVQGARPVGEHEGTIWLCWDTSLFKWVEATKTITAGAVNLQAVPSNKGVVYKGNLYVPQGGTGYEALDGAGPTKTSYANTVLMPVDFVVWDDKLVALTTTGQIRWSQNGADWKASADLTHAAAAATYLALPDGTTPRQLVLFFNRSDEDAVHIITDRDVWAWDPVTPKLYRTHLRFPPHMDQGLGASVWRDDMQVAVGVGVHGYNGSTIRVMGLDRDHGLPAEYRGRIMDLQPEYNGIYALVEGISEANEGEEELVLDAGPMDEQIYIGAERALSSLHVFTGFGWHQIWAANTASGSSTWSMVTTASDTYRLFWGHGEHIFTTVLRRMFHAPLQGLRAGIDRFQTDGFIETGRFDGGMAGYDKVASHIALVVPGEESGVNGMPDGCYIDVSWRTDRAPSYRSLGRVETSGRSVIHFDPDEHDFDPGDPFRWCQIRLDFHSDSATVSPVLESLVLKYIQRPNQSIRTWTVAIPLQFDDEWNARTPSEIRSHIRRLLTEPRFYTFQPYRDFEGGTNEHETFRVLISRSNGGDAVGPDNRGQRLLNLVEVPDNA
jgi:hypothetical protein